MRTPTIIKVVVKAERTMYGTPLRSRIPQRGKAMKPGISVTEPIREAKTVPENLLSLPSQREIVLSGTRERAMDTRTSMVRKAGRMFTNFLADILIAVTVFPRFARKESARAKAAITHRANKHRRSSDLSLAPPQHPFIPHP